MFRQALVRNPHQVEAHFSLGGLYLDQRRYQRAADAYMAALELQPDYADAWINLASVQLHLGRNAEALAAYRRCVSLELSADIRARVERQIAGLEAPAD